MAGPSPKLVAFLAIGCGLAVASIYYNQPMLSVLASDLGTTPERIGFIPTATQVGYGAGILLFAPLGDMLDRRRVIVVKAIALAASLVLAGLASSVVWLAAASLAIGLATTLAQDLVPAAAAIADPASRGKTVGTVMTGLLLGILLSRVVSGALTAWVSWRFIFFFAAAAMLAFAAIATRALPPFPPLAEGRYLPLLRSLVSLLRESAPLRRATLTQSLLCVTFSGFWSTLALGLAAPPFHLSSLVAGSFGIAGAAGAIAAPIAGGIADRRGPGAVVVFGTLTTIASFAAMAVFGSSIAVLVAATVAFDLGVQSCLIAHQTIVYAENPAARSRLNAILVSSMFLGMSTGALLASRVFVAYGFRGVSVLGGVFATLALAVRLTGGAAKTAPAG